MDAAILIASLVSLEQNAARAGDLTTRNFVIEAQDCILRMQRENLELRRENHVLRLGQPRRTDSSRAQGEATGFAPFVFPAIGSRPTQRAIDADLHNTATAGMASSV